MRRKRRQRQVEPDTGLEDITDLVNFDDVLSRELDEPTLIELDDEMPFAPTVLDDLGPVTGGDVVSSIALPTAATGSAAAADTALDSTEAENAMLRAELLAMPPTAAAPPAPVASAIAINQQSMAPQASTSIVAPQPMVDNSVGAGLESAVVASPVASAAMTLDRVAEPLQVQTTGRGVAGFEQYDFWDRYEEATASAELFAVPPAAITAVIGSLDVAVTVAERCQAGHWVSECDVFVLTERDHVDGQPTWKTVRRPSDVVAVIEGGESDFPLLVIDIPRELPAWVRPLVSRLRDGGVGLVHYVLGADPSDEDLATWHGELGRPAVLDLASPVAPERVLELLDRGEPVASVAGMPISTELLLALRLNNA